MKAGFQRCGVLALAAAGLLAGACTVMPTGPSVIALPGSSKSTEDYQADIAQCQQYSAAVIAANAGGTAAVANDRAASTAATSAVAGAAAGALIGSASGEAGRGAAIGAGTGLLFGGLAGSSYASMSSYQLQRAYDSVYLQCMYAHGNRVPMPRYARGPSRPSYSGAPSVGYPPPDSPAPSGLDRPGYPAPPDAQPSNYPPPDAAPPANLPPRR